MVTALDSPWWFGKTLVCCDHAQGSWRAEELPRGWSEWEPRPKMVVYTRLHNSLHSVLCNPNPTCTRDFLAPFLPKSKWTPAKGSTPPPSAETITRRPHQRRSQTQQSQRHARIRARNRFKDRMDRFLYRAQDGGARETRGPRDRRNHRRRRCGARFLFTSRLLIVSASVCVHQIC